MEMDEKELWVWKHKTLIPGKRSHIQRDKNLNFSNMATMIIKRDTRYNL